MLLLQRVKPCYTFILCWWCTLSSRISNFTTILLVDTHICAKGKICMVWICGFVALSIEMRRQNPGFLPHPILSHRRLLCWQLLPRQAGRLRPWNFRHCIIQDTLSNFKVSLSLIRVQPIYHLLFHDPAEQRSMLILEFRGLRSPLSLGKNL